MLDVGIERKVVQKAGSYFSFGDERLGQGRQNATAFLGEHPDLVQQILARIQAEAPPEQVVSARLLPQAEGAANVDVTPDRGRGGRDREGSGRGLEADRRSASRERDGRRLRGTRRHGPSRPRDRIASRSSSTVAPGASCRRRPCSSAGLAVGRALDRPTARALGARAAAARGAQALALRALRARDHTVASLERRLAERGAAPGVRRETLEAVQRAGLVDDQPLRARAAPALLAARGAGERLIARRPRAAGRRGRGDPRRTRRRSSPSRTARPRIVEVAGTNAADRALPGREGLLRGDARAARCRPVRRRGRLG